MNASKMLMVAFVFSWAYTMAQTSKTKIKVPPPEKIMANTLSDYEALMGTCQCKSSRRNAQGQWKDTVDLVWKWNYIMDGKGVKDEGWYRMDNKKYHFTSIRVYDSINQQWYVSYFTPNLQNPPETWVGGKEGKDIVLKKEQKTAQGPMQSVLTFSNISPKGFTWQGKLVNQEKNMAYPFWNIWCTKEN